MSEYINVWSTRGCTHNHTSTYYKERKNITRDCSTNTIDYVWLKWIITTKTDWGPSESERTDGSPVRMCTLTALHESETTCTLHTQEKDSKQCPTNRTFHQVVDRWTEHALERVGRLGHAEPVWSYLRLQGPIQRWRKEEKQLLEKSVASAVFSRALDNTNVHG